MPIHGLCDWTARPDVSLAGAARAAQNVAVAREPALDTYLQEINRVPLLTAESEHELAIKVRDGDPEARDLMIRSNLRLVVSVAKIYNNRGLPLMDLIEEGNLGLLKAVQEFDPDRETRFSTYATWWIKQAIRRALVNTAKTVRIPSYLAEKIHRVKQVRGRLESEMGRTPSVEEIADAMRPRREDVIERLKEKLGRTPTALELKTEIRSLKVDPSLVERAIRADESGASAVSLDAMVAGNDGLPDRSGARPEDALFASQDRERMRDALRTLEPREELIIKLRYGLTDDRDLLLLDPQTRLQGDRMTLKEVGEHLKLTRERVRQIEAEALRKLERFLASRRD
jgi:RNA polymerase primary sigma factor